MGPHNNHPRVDLTFDRFGWEELKTEARASGLAIREITQRALTRYVERLGSGDAGRLSAQIPDFIREPGPEKTIGLEVEVSPGVLEALGRQARRQEIPVGRLAEHAVFTYLASSEASGGSITRQRDQSRFPRRTRPATRR
jgi:hypothetical protein